MAKNRLEQDINDAHQDGEEEVDGAIAVPFSLEEVAMVGGRAAGPGDADAGASGQFSGDDLEFESFMFDKGDVQDAAQAVNVPQASAADATDAQQAPIRDVTEVPQTSAPDAAGPSPALPWISGETVPAPATGAAPQAAQQPPQASAFIEDTSVPHTPPATLAAMQGPSAH